MRNNESYRWRRQMMWGLLLVLFGIGLLLDQLGMLEVRRLWHFWPLVLVAIGVNRMIGFPSARDFTGGFWLACVGIWLFLTLEHKFGLTVQNSWPVFIIISGVTIVLEPLIARRLKSGQSDDGKG